WRPPPGPLSTGFRGETSRARRCKPAPLYTRNFPLYEKTMTLTVKICGLSTRETLDVALESGADMVGFVFFPPSPRHISLETARDLGRRVRHRAIKVALTVDADDATLEGIVEALEPDILQLHGHESPARLSEIKRKFRRDVMKALPVERAADLASLPD